MHLLINLFLVLITVALIGALIDPGLMIFSGLLGFFRLFYLWSESSKRDDPEEIEEASVRPSPSFKQRARCEAAWRALDLEALRAGFERSQLKQGHSLIIDLEIDELPPFTLRGSRFTELDPSKRERLPLGARFEQHYHSAGDLRVALAYLDPARVERLSTLGGLVSIEEGQLVVMLRDLVRFASKRGDEPDEVVAAINDLVKRGLEGGDLQSAFEARLPEMKLSLLKRTLRLWSFEEAQRFMVGWERAHKMTPPLDMWLSIARTHGDERENIRALILNRRLSDHLRLALLHHHAASEPGVTHMELALSFFEGKIGSTSVYVIGHLNEIGAALPSWAMEAIFQRVSVFSEAHTATLLDLLERRWDDAAFGLIEARLLAGDEPERLRCVALLREHARDLRLLSEALEEARSSGERRVIREAIAAARKRLSTISGAVSHAEARGQLSHPREGGGLSEA